VCPARRLTCQPTMFVRMLERRKALLMLALAAMLLVPTTASASFLSDNADAWFTDYLTQRFGPYDNAYVHCDNYWWDDEYFRDVGECSAHLHAEDRWHLLFGSGQAYDGEESISFYDDQAPWHRSWERKWRRASRRCMRQTVDPLPLRGKLLSNGSGCDARLAMEVTDNRTFLHGTGLGSFPEIASYRCRQGGRTQYCINAVGDAFKYTFPRRLKCGGDTGEGWTLHPQGGAGRYNLTTRNVQCTPAQMFVTNMKYPRRWHKGVTWRARTRYWGTYRCKLLRVGYEFADIRCTASRGRVLRWQEGA
jgi:hypothetical protein